MIKKKQLRKLLIKITLILLLILSIALIIQSDLISKIKSLQRPLSQLQIKDECSLIMGNLLHQIKDDGECQIKCRQECELRELEFYFSEFLEQTNDCHKCDCYCK